jgi:hypothetical protein
MIELICVQADQTLEVSGPLSRYLARGGDSLFKVQGMDIELRAAGDCGSSKMVKKLLPIVSTPKTF